MINVKEIFVKNYISVSKLPDADYVINPYIGCPHKCLYCYAEFMKRFTNHNENWGDFIDIKICNENINFDKIKNSTILFGSVTDAYNPYEKKYKITQKILEELLLSKCDSKIEILTKSDLVIRDIDLLKKLPNIRVGISMNSLDDKFRRQIEPYASSIENRIKTLKVLHDSGISTYLFMSPIFPGITNYREIIDTTYPYVDEFYFENLNLRGSYLPRVLNYISNFHKELVGLYNDIYKFKRMSYWEFLSNDINSYCLEKKLIYKLYFYHQKIKKV